MFAQSMVSVKGGRMVDAKDMLLTGSCFLISMVGHDKKRVKHINNS